MNNSSRHITGIVLIIVGLLLLVISFSAPWLLVYGIPAPIIGVYILFNKKEDEIEKIKGEKK